MKIKGIPAFQRLALKKHLTNDVNGGEFEICFNDSISLKRLHSLWYGGNIADVKYKGYTFHIEAAGDVRCSLNRSSSDDTVCYVKDKRNGGVFGSEMQSYIRSDKALYEMLNHKHRKFYLETHDNNWWECFVTDGDGKFHDIMRVLDNDSIFDAIKEVIGSFDEIINNLNGE